MADIFKGPPHGWSALVWEVGVVVVGVLIALWAGQVLSDFNDRERREETRQVLGAEIRLGLAHLAKRQHSEACGARRLAEVEHWLDEDARGAKPLRPTLIGRPYAPLLGKDRFLSEQSAGRLVLLSNKDRSLIDEIYKSFDDFNTANTREIYDWAQLRSLASSTASLDGAERSRLRGAIQDARAADLIIRLDMLSVAGPAAKLGLKPATDEFQDDVDGTVCLPMNPSSDQLKALQTAIDDI
ncbi:hypothetical protein ABDK56_11815 [Sphingomonas sp. ASV193]|uniref:hypothetical protein n=1 Tax=Sphingomonas sp. ASV193 TaxID=3144405 RepID=UPI0032E861C5